MIKAIFFDMDGTLRTHRPAGREVFMQIAAEYLSLEVDDVLSRKILLWEHYYWAQSPELCADKVNRQEDDSFWVRYSLRQLVAMDCDLEQARELAPQVSARMTTAYKPEDVLLPHTESALEALRNSGYRMAVLSNRENPFDDHLSRLGIAAYFDFTIAAGVVQSYKPDPRIFTHALQQAGVTAAETIYVGDNFHADVVGARNAGIHPVLIDPQRIFPKADCPVISTLAELPELVSRM